MQDFFDYANSQDSQNSVKDLNPDFVNLVGSLSSKFDGKNQNELLKAIYDQAEKGKRNGTLSNAEIDGFARTLAPLLDDKKKKILYKIVDELKKI